MDNQHLQTIIAFSSQKGFIWGPEPEIYGGLSGFYTYGPLGKLLKNKVEKTIRDTFIRHDFFEVECPTVMPGKVWEASGHLGGFTDPIVTCSQCKVNFRADELIAEKYPELKDAIKEDNVLVIIKEKKMACPSCAGAFKDEVSKHNLMMKTTIGMDTEAYLRPETATTTYLPFVRYADFFRNKLPFGVFQIGKAYRNEISPRQYLLRVREFTQGEGQLFIHPDEKMSYHKFDLVSDTVLPFLPSVTDSVQHLPLKEALSKGWFKSKAYGWTLFCAYDLFTSIGIPKEALRLRQHHDDEKAFYAADAWDVDINLPSFGWTEMCGVHDRTDYDLKQHATNAKRALEITLDDGKKVVPHVLEIAFGIDRPVFALLDLFYDKKKEAEGKSLLKIPLEVCPVQVAVLPLFKKDNLPDEAHLIEETLREEFIVKYDETQSIGKRYLRAGEEGIPFCVTVDYDTLKDKTVTLRDRDSEKQSRVKIDELRSILHRLFAKTITFSELPVYEKQAENPQG